MGEPLGEGEKKGHFIIGRTLKIVRVGCRTRFLSNTQGPGGSSVGGGDIMLDIKHRTGN